ncbi:Phosphatidylinositol 4-kinase gamma 5 [Linum perenne]
MHRSSSSPCLSPCAKDPQLIDQSNPVEILGFSDRFAEAKPLVREITKALRNNIHPTPTFGGLGGAYYFKNCQFENIAIVKPTDEEPYAPNNPKGFVGKALGQPGLKRSVRDGIGRFGQVELFPIDHGLCLPENLENPYFEWIHWPQASIPFSDDELDYISKLDPFRDSDMLRRELPMIREACLRILVVCTIFLKQAATFGLCLGEIDCEEELDAPLKMLDKDSRTLSYGSRSGNGWNLLSKLEESLEEEDEDADGEGNGMITSAVDTNTTDPTRDVALMPSFSKRPMLSKNPSLGEKSWRHEITTQKHGCMAGISSGNRSVNEQLLSSCSVVKLSELTEGEWTQFLEIFQKLLYPAFENRESGKAGQKHRQRLGSSCQF